MKIIKRKIYKCFKNCICLFLSNLNYWGSVVHLGRCIMFGPNLYGRMDGSKFWCFPWFPENSLLCVILRYTVYLNKNFQRESGESCNIRNSFNQFLASNHKKYWWFTIFFFSTFGWSKSRVNCSRVFTPPRSPRISRL